MRKLDDEIEDIINEVTPGCEKELSFLNEDLWEIITNRKVRKSRLETHVLLISRALSNASRLYNAVDGDITHPDVKATLKLLASFYDTFKSRSAMYLDTEDWTKYRDTYPEKDVDAAIADEVELHSYIALQQVKFKKLLSTISLDESKVVVNVPTRNNAPVPFLMREAVEERYPEIKTLMAIKMAPAEGATVPDQPKAKRTYNKKPKDV